MEVQITAEWQGGKNLRVPRKNSSIIIYNRLSHTDVRQQIEDSIRITTMYNVGDAIVDEQIQAPSYITEFPRKRSQKVTEAWRIIPEMGGT